MLSPHWEYSVASEPRDWELLQRAHWKEYRQWCGCEVKVDAALEEVAAQISSDLARRQAGSTPSMKAHGA